MNLAYTLAQMGTREGILNADVYNPPPLRQHSQWDFCAGVGKSMTAVNLAYTLAQMGARVGILDADVYGPSLPTMVSPEAAVLQMDPVTKNILPTEYEGVKLVSFGFAGQGSAIMRGAMVSGGWVFGLFCVNLRAGNRFGGRGGQ